MSVKQTQPTCPNIELVRYSVVHCISLNQTNILNQFLAAQEGHKDIVEMLIDSKRVDVNIKDNYGCTPLYACNFLNLILKFSKSIIMCLY